MCLLAGCLSQQPVLQERLTSIVEDRKLRFTRVGTLSSDCWITGTAPGSVASLLQPVLALTFCSTKGHDEFMNDHRPSGPSTS